MTAKRVFLSAFVCFFASAAFAVGTGIGSDNRGSTGPGTGIGDGRTGEDRPTEPSKADFKGFIRVRSDRELYVETIKAQPGKETVVLLNGLTYSLRQYDAFASRLQQRGLGVVRFDFDGMGQSLLRYAPSMSPYPAEQQAKDLHVLLAALKIAPPYNLVGLSYGGGIEVAYALQFPREIRRMILIAPYTEPLEGQDNWIKTQVATTRATFPLNPYSDEELYDYFLHQYVYSTYPASEPIVLENPFKLEAVYNLVRGIRKFLPVNFADKLPAGTVHMMQAVSDQYVPKEVLEKFWKKVPTASKMTRIYVYQTEHKMPEAVPDFTAAWVNFLLKGGPLTSGNREFEGFAYTKSIHYGNKSFELKD